MPFGLINAPAAFQYFVNTVFADLLDVCSIVYLDDILIYSADMASHKKHVQEVLWQLCTNSLFAKLEKCEFYTESTEYLGYQLSPSGLTMSLEKVKSIQDWPKPQKIKDMQSFLSFANFYRHFIHNYSGIITPLTHFTHKGIPWNFSDSCCSAFQNLKDTFISTPILTYWVLDTPIIIETDASDYAITGILSICCPDKEIRPVIYYSQTLSTLELNYNTHDKTLLTIHKAFRSWHHYLEGSATLVDVITNYKNLEYVTTIKLLTQQQACWSEFLS